MDVEADDKFTLNGFLTVIDHGISDGDMFEFGMNISKMIYIKKKLKSILNFLLPIRLSNFLFISSKPNSFLSHFCY